MENDTVVDISQYFGMTQTTEHAVELACGGIIQCAFMVHPSVGFTVEHEIVDSSVLQLQETTSEYIHPEAVAKGMCGADEEKGIWRFKAVGRGATVLFLKQFFRGEIHGECRVTVTVR